MFKTYTYKSITFQTITIPKGTVLFRGLRFDNETQYDSLFHDMIGYKKDNSYTISPSMNVFFYPVPYVSDVVSIYDIHAIYLCSK